MNIFSNNFYDCNSPDNPDIIISRQKINCKYWSFDKKCNTICSLNVINNPSMADCFNCPKREATDEYKEAIKEKTLPKPIKVYKNESIKEPSFLQKAKSYIKAETSQLIQGKVSEEIYNKRKKLCIACHYKLNPKPDEEEIGWCKGGCGCKVGNPRAALSEKLYMPSISCPLKKFGPEQGNGFNVEDAVNSLKGAATAIVNTIEEEKGNT